jgi:signal peptidase I
MMGDNRDNSTDSRVPPEQGGVGFVPSQNLVGRAEMIFFSVKDGNQAWEFWRWPWSVRFARLFQPVR